VPRDTNPPCGGTLGKAVAYHQGSLST